MYKRAALGPNRPVGRSLDKLHSIPASNYEYSRETDEQAMLYDAGYALDPACQVSRVLYLRKTAIQNKVALVAYEWLAISLSNYCLAVKSLNGGGCPSPAESNDLDRYRLALTKVPYEFAFVGDNDLLLTGDGNQLLAKERTAPALDQVEGTLVDFVGPIDRQI